MIVSQLLLIGLVLIVAGILVLLYSIIKEDGGARVEAGGLVMIGPIPILVASSRRIGLALLLITAAILAVLIASMAGVAS
jgi:uncharacterized membrane protein